MCFCTAGRSKQNSGPWPANELLPGRKKKKGIKIRSTHDGLKDVMYNGLYLVWIKGIRRICNPEPSQVWYKHCCACFTDEQSQRGSLKEGDFLPTVGKIETDKDYAFKQNAQMSSLGSNQPTMLRLEGTLKCEGPCSPAQPRGEDSLPWHAGLWALEQFSSLIMCASSPNSSRPIVSLPPLKADQSQRKGGQNGCRGPGAWSKW